MQDVSSSIPVSSTKRAKRVIVYLVIAIVAISYFLTSSHAQAQSPLLPEPLFSSEAQTFEENQFPTVVNPFIDESFSNSYEPIFPLTISPDWHWEFLPQGFLYHTYWASAAEPRLSTQLTQNSGSNVDLDSYIAGRLGILRFGRSDREEGFQLDLLGGAKLRQDLDHEIDMTGTDYRFDLPLTYRHGPHAWKTGFYHISSHTGDEFLIENPGYPRLNYYRDAFYLGYSYFLTPELRTYAEIDYAIQHEYSEPLHIQFGFDYGPAEPTGVLGAPFFAMNVHLREELNFGGNINLQGGWAWKGAGLAAGTLRTGPFYYNGGSPQFSFYKENEQLFGWGLWYDF